MAIHLPGLVTYQVSLFRDGKPRLKFSKACEKYGKAPANGIVPNISTHGTPEFIKVIYARNLVFLTPKTALPT